MSDAVSVESLFRDAADLFVLLGMDRRVRIANPALRASLKGTKAGIDFLDVVPEAARSRVATELARSAGGATVHVEIDHERADGRGARVEWRFFPVEGGLVAGVGRARGDEPA